MAAELFFGAAVRHGDDSGAGDGFRFEAFVHREAEHERVAGGQAAFQLREDGRQALVAQGLVFRPASKHFFGGLAANLAMT